MGDHPSASLAKWGSVNPSAYCPSSWACGDLGFPYPNPHSTDRDIGAQGRGMPAQSHQALAEEPGSESQEGSQRSGGPTVCEVIEPKSASSNKTFQGPLAFRAGQPGMGLELHLPGPSATPGDSCRDPGVSGAHHDTAHQCPQSAEGEPAAWAGVWPGVGVNKQGQRGPGSPECLCTAGTWQACAPSAGPQVSSASRAARPGGSFPITHPH